MELVFPGDLQCLPAGIGLKEGVALRGQVNLQSRDDVPFVVADQNIGHIRSPPLSVPFSIVAQFYLRIKGRNIKVQLRFPLPPHLPAAAGIGWCIPAHGGEHNGEHPRPGRRHGGLHTGGHVRPAFGPRPQHGPGGAGQHQPVLLLLPL